MPLDLLIGQLPMTTTDYKLSAEQQDEVERFVTAESANVAAAEARNKKRKPKDKKISVNTLKDFIRQHDWPPCDIVKDWLHSADPTHKLGVAAGEVLGQPSHQLLIESSFICVLLLQKCRLSKLQSADCGFTVLIQSKQIQLNYAHACPETLR